ncbi:MAG: lysophospholipid acyltransferase family protein [Desulfarculaceae bacterium]|nr:lysophospholipid acyltransferase family protein [Desulfarculaceae bacterium]MCF8071305.1 lysophospholipid acyltransferase family protein [Desulfarculaceae bacterium]MCF8101630.1 lysophospholipid acyltransferase family protein [Desulfarculaceae bacterium]MCF8117430.1 lysophospholipid acyltransferase family protein [Desulfarculaceae bacterium]
MVRLKAWLLTWAKTRLQLKDLSSFLQLSWNTWIFGALPAWLSRWYLGVLGWLYFHLASKETGAIKRSLAHCLPGGMPRRTWQRTRAGIIDHYHEKLYLAFKSFPTIRANCLKRVKITNQEVLDQAVAQGRGVLLITGHYGALEFMPGALAFRDYPLSVMVHCKTPRLRAILEDRSSRAGTELMDPKSGEVFFTAVEHLKRGRVLVTQCDEISMWKPYKDKTTRFLGLDVPLDRSMDLLARKSKAVVVMGLVHRLGGRRYELELLDPRKHPAGQGQTQVSAQCLSVLSDYVLKQPNQWYEWKKLNQFLPAQADAVNANNKPERLFDTLALQPGGVPQPG